MEGKVFNTNNSGTCVVMAYQNYENVLVRFIETGYTTLTSKDNLVRGKVKDYLSPSIYGKGVLGENFKPDESKAPCFKLWKNMLKRCYSKASIKDSPTYTECYVSDNFKYYPYFKDWRSNQIGFNVEGFELDKDILIKGNKLYSENTCCFVPKELNLLLVKHDKGRGNFALGVDYHKTRKQFRARCGNKHLGWFSTEQEAFQAYKQAKEDYIKSLANKWKDKIDPRVYEALMNWSVEITD